MCFTTPVSIRNRYDVMWWQTDIDWQMMLEVQVSEALGITVGEWRADTHVNLCHTLPVTWAWTNAWPRPPARSNPSVNVLRCHSECVTVRLTNQGRRISCHTVIKVKWILTGSEWPQKTTAGLYRPALLKMNTISRQRSNRPTEYFKASFLKSTKLRRPRFGILLTLRRLLTATCVSKRWMISLWIENMNPSQRSWLISDWC